MWLCLNITNIGSHAVWQLIPLHLLHHEFEILEGNTEVLLPLLLHIRKVRPASHCQSCPESRGTQSSLCLPVLQAYGRYFRPLKRAPKVPSLLESRHSANGPSGS
jgi:hypothetical protein